MSYGPRRKRRRQKAKATSDLNLRVPSFKRHLAITRCPPQGWHLIYVGCCINGSKQHHTGRCGASSQLSLVPSAVPVGVSELL